MIGNVIFDERLSTSSSIILLGPSYTAVIYFCLFMFFLEALLYLLLHFLQQYRASSLEHFIHRIFFVFNYCFSRSHFFPKFRFHRAYVNTWLLYFKLDRNFYLKTLVVLEPKPEKAIQSLF